ncbi:MAG: hypothetical protein GY712_14590 [Oceanicoccus sp.]|uniref:hypothetical protein n=1 Tax=Oceanicoccus sp. TaxID=2691044 RepID=UPI00260EFC14|nr:hypothetical protein [Oceanicoccus sp.]MCP3909229.1 hypothetical protein [Oceanicoccus sp.]
MTLQAAIEDVQATIGAISGIKAAPNYAPEKINEYPFSVAYMGGGLIDFDTPSATKGLHIIVIELHVARKDLPNDISIVAPFIDSIPAALMADPTLGGTVGLFENITYEFTPMQWDAVETIGYRFFINGVSQRSC